MCLISSTCFLVVAVIVMLLTYFLTFSTISSGFNQTPVIGGTISAATNLVSSVSNIFGKDSPKTKRPEDSYYGTTSTGYYQALKLQQFLEQYSEAKKDPKKEPFDLHEKELQDKVELAVYSVGVVVAPVRSQENQSIILLACQRWKYTRRVTTSVPVCYKFQK